MQTVDPEGVTEGSQGWSAAEPLDAKGKTLAAPTGLPALQSIQGLRFAPPLATFGVAKM